MTDWHWVPRSAGESPRSGKERGKGRGQRLIGNVCQGRPDRRESGLTILDILWAYGGCGCIWVETGGNLLKVAQNMKRWLLYNIPLSSFLFRHFARTTCPAPPSEEADLCGHSPEMGHLYKDKTALGRTTVETKAGSAG